MSMLRAAGVVLCAAVLGVIAAGALANLPMPRDPAFDTVRYESRIHERGIDTLVLGSAYADAVALTRRAISDPVLDGPGCDGRDQISYKTTLADLPVSIMAMADEGYLHEIEAWLSTPRRADDEAACVTLRDRFARPFLGLGDSSREHPLVMPTLIRPISREHRVEVGPVVLYAQWFPSDGTCYVGARFD